MPYPVILFDIDNTLIDFTETAKAASAAVLSFGGHSADSESTALYFEFNDKTWSGLNLDNVDDSNICRSYHELYRKYLFEANRLAGIEMKLTKNSSELTECFITELGRCAVPNVNAVEICRQLSPSHTLCIASNGLTSLQISKLSLFKPYLSHFFISEDLDCIKPEERYFKYILKQLQCSASDCIMVGDSLKNDIWGANQSKIASCYYNPNFNENLTGISPTYEIHDFKELLDIV